MDIDITMPDLLEVDINGNANADIRGFNEKYIGVFGSGNSDIYIDADADIFDIVTSGNADIKTVGNGNDLYLNMTGSSDVNSRNLRVRQADVILSGTADAVVNASNLIYGEASGASCIKYKNNPKIDVLLSGSSIIRRD